MSDIIGGNCPSGPYGWAVNPAGVEGICLGVESIGWDLAAPHADLHASMDWAAGLFGDEDEKQVADAIHKTWNRVLARNMVYTEATIQNILSSVRTATSYLQAGNCEMAQTTADQITRLPDGRVADGAQP